MWHTVSLLLIKIGVFATAFWGSCALYFGDSHTGQLQILSAFTFAIIALLTLIAQMLPQWRFRMSAVYCVLFAGVLTWWLNIPPSNQRHWQTDVDKLAYASVDGDRVTMHNIRNFEYRSEFDYQPAYYDKTYDLSKLQGVDLFAVYWMGPAIAHTLISFDFGNNDYLAVSIEARKEEGESYSSIKGFFRQYELIYIVADERDVIRLRTNFRQNPTENVYLYRLKGPRENLKRLFLEYIKNINAIHDHPVFYSTLFTNCTNTIWLNSKVNPGHLPFSWKILVSGYVPEYLYEQARLDQSMPFSELRAQALINTAAQNAGSAADFSTRIRYTISSTVK